MSPVAAAGQANEPGKDPGGAEAAINRYRDLAKYLVTIFAGVGALLAAGTQLSSLGKLSLTDDTPRLAAAAVALVIAIGAVVLIVKSALKVLTPVEMSLDAIIANSTIRNAIEQQRSMLMGQNSVGALKRAADAALADDPDDVITAEDQARW